MHTLPNHEPVVEEPLMFALQLGKRDLYMVLALCQLACRLVVGTRKPHRASIRKGHMQCSKGLHGIVASFANSPTSPSSPNKK